MFNYSLRPRCALIPNDIQKKLEITQIMFQISAVAEDARMGARSIRKNRFYLILKYWFSDANDVRWMSEGGYIFFLTRYVSLKSRCTYYVAS